MWAWLSLFVVVQGVRVWTLWFQRIMIKIGNRNRTMLDLLICEALVYQYRHWDQSITFFHKQKALDQTLLIDPLQKASGLQHLCDRSISSKSSFPSIETNQEFLSTFIMWKCYYKSCQNSSTDAFTPSCALHKCKADDCKQPRCFEPADTEYCMYHKCVDPSCVDTRRDNDEYCYGCECVVPDCSGPQFYVGDLLRNLYCLQHTCEQDGCLKKIAGRTGVSRHCADHAGSENGNDDAGDSMA